MQSPMWTWLRGLDCSSCTVVWFNPHLVFWCKLPHTWYNKKLKSNWIYNLRLVFFEELHIKAPTCSPEWHFPTTAHPKCRLKPALNYINALVSLENSITCRRVATYTSCWNAQTQNILWGQTVKQNRSIIPYFCPSHYMWAPYDQHVSPGLWTFKGRIPWSHNSYFFMHATSFKNNMVKGLQMTWLLKLLNWVLESFDSVKLVVLPDTDVYRTSAFMLRLCCPDFNKESSLI